LLIKAICITFVFMDVDSIFIYIAIALVANALWEYILLGCHWVGNWDVMFNPSLLQLT
jgi:hypothetical protein